MRSTAHFAALLLVFYLLQDPVGAVGTCFDPQYPFEPVRLPVCMLLSIGHQAERLEGSDLAGLLWHYLPSIVAALAIAWTLKGRRRSGRTRLTVHLAVLLFVLSVLYESWVLAFFCFPPTRPILPQTVPLCVLTHFEMLARGWGKGGLPGLLWYFLPPIMASFLIAIVWLSGKRAREPA